MCRKKWAWSSAVISLSPQGFVWGTKCCMPARRATLRSSLVPTILSTRVAALLSERSIIGDRSACSEWCRSRSLTLERSR